MGEGLHQRSNPNYDQTNDVRLSNTDINPANLVYYPPDEQHLEGLTVEPQERSFWSEAKTFITRKYSPGPWRHAVKQVFPILKQIETFRTKYTWESFIADALCGGTVCTLLIPQSLSYATLAGLPAQYGLYTAFLASLVYMVFGTCRETSLGPFALVSLMVAQIVNEMYPDLVEFETLNPTQGLELRLMYTMTLTFVSGVILLVMAALKLGWVIDLFSSPSLQAFLMGAAYAVGATQIGSCFGIQTAQGSFLITLISLIKNITTMNLATTLIGLVALILCCLADIYSTRKQLKIPLPAQIIIVMISTFLSWLFSFNEKFGVKVIGSIQSGFRPPSSPSFSLIFGSAEYWINAIPVAASAFVVLASISAQMAEKFRDEYQVNYNSETLSLGMASFIGSFFNAYPSSAAYSRTTVCLGCKPRTNLWNLFTAIVLGLIIVVAGPLAYHLPTCVLGAVVLASFRQSYLNWRQGVVVWKQNAGEGVVYYFTFFSTILISIQAGVFAAFLGSIMHIVLSQATFVPNFMSQIPHTQRFISTTRLPAEENDFFGFLERIENSGGIYKLNARDEARRNREAREIAKIHKKNNVDDDNNNENSVNNNNDSTRLHTRPGHSSSFHDGDDDAMGLPHQSFMLQQASPTIRDDFGNLDQLTSVPSTSSIASRANNQRYNDIQSTSTSPDIIMDGQQQQQQQQQQLNSNSIQLDYQQRSSSHIGQANDIIDNTVNSSSRIDLYGDITGVNNEFAMQFTTPSAANIVRMHEDQQNGISDHDPRILVLHIGTGLTFLNAAPIGDYIIRYLEMYKRYCQFYPQIDPTLKHAAMNRNGNGNSNSSHNNNNNNNNDGLYPIAPCNLKSYLNATSGLVTPPFQPNNNNNQTIHHQQYTLHDAPYATPQYNGISGHVIPPLNLDDVTTTSSSSSLISTQHASSTLTMTAQIHPINHLTTRHRNFMKLFGPSRLLSAQQQLLISTMLQEVFLNVSEDTLIKFSMVVIFDHVTKIDITALKTLYMLQKTFPQLLILFTRPGEELIEQLTFKQSKSKTQNLHLPTKLIFDSIYVAQEFSRYLLNSAEQGQLYQTWQQSSSIPIISPSDQ